VDDETDIEEVTVVSLSSEVVRVQSIAYDLIEREVIHNLRSHGISVDMYDDILKQVESKLEHDKVKIDYY
jgi:predicted metal-dependent phosphotriesterase family hydrolase